MFEADLSAFVSVQFAVELLGASEAVLWSGLSVIGGNLERPYPCVAVL